MRTNATAEQLQRALDSINLKYFGNIEFNRFDITGSRVNFTLKVKDSKKVGARKSHTGRRLINACFHVHGNFFDALFKENPFCFIKSRGKTITEEAGNWEDFNAGSLYNPVMFSELCHCDQ